MLKKRQSKYLIILLSFILFSFLSSFVFLHTHILFSADDMEFHLKRVMELRYRLLHFNILPQYGINFFHGSALMSMYPFYSLLPLAFITFFIHSYINAYYLFLMLITLVTLCVSFFSSFSVSKSIRVSYLFSILYGMSSSFVMMMFTNGDLGVITSLSFLPMAIFGFIDLLNHRINYLKLALGLSLMLYCQLPAFVITLGFLLLWLLINVNDINKSMLVCFLKVIVLITLLTSIVWLPLLHIILFNSINSVSIPAYLQGVNVKEFIKYISIFAILSIVICPFYLSRMSKIFKQMYWFSLAILIISSSLMPWKTLIYNYHINILKALNIFQFSFRFLIIPQILLCYVCSTLISKCLLKKHVKLFKITYISIILIIVLLQIMSQGYLVNRRQAQNKIYITNYQKPKKAFKNRIRYVVPNENGIKYLSEGYLGMTDYYPKSSLNEVNNIDNNIGLINKGKLIKFHHIGNDEFSFDYSKRSRELQLPLLNYNNEKLRLKLDNKKIKYTKIRNIIVIKNISPGFHKLNVNVKPNYILYISEIILWLMGLLWIIEYRRTTL